MFARVIPIPANSIFAKNGYRNFPVRQAGERTLERSVSEVEAIWRGL
jgi:hypothetical protein